MLSRVADRMYWLGRYVERAENTARLVNVNTSLMLDLPRATQPPWRSVTDIIDSTDLFLEHYEKTDERNIVRFMLADPRNPGSLLNSVLMARENARTTREILPSEAWELVTEMQLYAKEHISQSLKRSARHDALDEIISYCHRFNGLIVSSLSRTDAYCFINIGINLERADMTTRILDVGSANLLQPGQEGPESYENILWMNVLRSLSAYQMYRQHVQDRVNAEDVVTFLLKDNMFPRAVAHCLLELDGYCRTLPRNDNPLRSIAHTARVVADLDVKRTMDQSLHAFIDSLQLDLAGVHTELANTWFTLEDWDAAQAQKPAGHSQRQSATG